MVVVEKQTKKMEKPRGLGKVARGGGGEEREWGNSLKDGRAARVCNCVREREKSGRKTEK